ncbi:hypothetical protein BGZ46_004269 [Entomortierella lignicola]|nr:hypothetical protein BGZ46_004269 [Entomortierella lignicola]
MASSRNSPKIILGSMTFGLEETNSVTSTVRVRGVESVKSFVDLFHSHGHIEIDSARIYCGGDTETVLGQLGTDSYKVATKVWPGAPNAHAPEQLRKTLRESLTALKSNKIDVFYLHAPDYTTPFEETVKAVDELYREGLFERFGLSNFAAWQVTFIHQICKQNGYVLPTVYQGMYNVITRDVVRELLPCLRALNIDFYAFNPIAGGLLSGRYQLENESKDGGRFDENTGFGKLYRQRFWTKLFFDAIKKMENVTKEHNLTLVESALRWLVHHSGLGPNDGIIIGVSSIGHLESNLKDLEKGPLPKEVLEVFDEAWEDVKVACPSYFKPPTSADFVLARK